MRRRFQRHIYGTLNGIQTFSFFGPNIFLNISNSDCGTDATEVSTTPTRFPERYTTISVLHSKFFFCMFRILCFKQALRRLYVANVAIHNHTPVFKSIHKYTHFCTSIQEYTSIFTSIYFFT